MILGAIQVVVNVADLAAAERPLLAAGFARSFHEPALAVHAAKAPLLGAPRAALAMSHLAPPSPAPAIELTAYAGDPPTGEAAYALAVDDGGLPERVVAATDDAAASGAFWEALAAPEEPGAGGLRRFAAALPAWRLAVELAPGESRAGRTTLDAPGCVLVSVLTSRVAPELARLQRLGVLRRATAAWSEEVDGRELTVAIVEGPAGELVELLQIPSGQWR